MLTEEEKNGISRVFNSVVGVIDAMISIIGVFESHRSSIVSLINSRKHNSTFELELNNYVSKAEVLQRLRTFYSSSINLDGEVSEHYKTFLQNEFTKFSVDNLPYMHESIRRTVSEFIGRIIQPNYVIQNHDNNPIQYLTAIPNSYITTITELEKLQCELIIFDRIKGITGSIVLVGANGSGKSTFARQLKGTIGGNVVILSAQNLLIYTQKGTINTSGNEREQVWAFQENDKLTSRNDFSQLITADMNQLISALRTDQTKILYKNRNDHVAGFENKTILEQTVDLWKEIIEHRTIRIDFTGLTVYGDNITDYDFNLLSDGEKSVFYYIAHVLLSKPNSYIIIDEPENHVHVSICNKLWDALEKRRPDCKFVYLTHNLNFAVSRNSCTILWNKKFEPPYDWEYQELPKDEMIPESLIIELVGSRKNILFCESPNRSKLDFKLYSVLFPDYTVIPAGNHSNVISYVNAYNSQSSFETKAVGIVDHDHYKQEQIDKWKGQHIYTLPVNEVENILCDENVLKKAAEQFYPPEGAVDGYLNEFWNLLASERQVQATMYVSEYLNNTLQEHLLEERRDISALKSEFHTNFNDAEIDRLYTESLSKIDNFLSSRDYAEAIKFVNFKSRMTRIASNNIVDKYPDRVLDLIKRDDDLKDYIKNTYFAGFSDVARV